MTKIAYTAMFSDGTTITRKSDRTYTHAYRWTGTADDGRTIGGDGFAASKQLAERAMRSAYGWLVNPPVIRGRRSPAYVAHMLRAIQEWRPGTVTFAEVTTAGCKLATPEPKHGCYPSTRLVEGGWGIFVQGYRNNVWLETNENTQPWPSAARALDAARSAAQEMAERMGLPVRG